MQVTRHRMLLTLKNIPFGLINLITEYATDVNQKWILYITERGFLRKVWRYGFTNIDAAFLFKEFAMRNVTSHSITYNNGRVFQNALTFEQPLIVSGETRTLIRRTYTVVEVAPDKYDYILCRRIYVNGHAITCAQSFLYRPYISNEWGKTQLLTSAETTRGYRLTNIQFAEWNGWWEWNAQLGIYEFVVEMPQANDDEDDEEIDWADNDEYLGFAQAQ